MVMSLRSYTEQTLVSDRALRSPVSQPLQAGGESQLANALGWRAANGSPAHQRERSVHRISPLTPPRIVRKSATGLLRNFAAIVSNCDNARVRPLTEAPPFRWGFVLFAQ